MQEIKVYGMTMAQELSAVKAENAALRAEVLTLRNELGKAQMALGEMVVWMKGGAPSWQS